MSVWIALMIGSTALITYEDVSDRRFSVHYLVLFLIASYIHFTPAFFESVQTLCYAVLLIGILKLYFSVTGRIAPLTSYLGLGDLLILVGLAVLLPAPSYLATVLSSCVLGLGYALGSRILNIQIETIPYAGCLLMPVFFVL